MTKRDVAVWFCKVVALQGMIIGALGGLRTLFSWRYLGVANLFYPTLALGLYLFVWFFARGIGTELAAEGEHGPSITSGAEIGSLLLRCVGLWLFLSGSISFGPAMLGWAYQYFVGNRLSLSSSISQNIMLTNTAIGFLQSGLGFLLAFTPRLRSLFRS